MILFLLTLIFSLPLYPASFCSRITNGCNTLIECLRVRPHTAYQPIALEEKQDKDEEEVQAILQKNRISKRISRTSTLDVLPYHILRKVFEFAADPYRWQLQKGVPTPFVGSRIPHQGVSGITVRSTSPHHGEIFDLRTNGSMGMIHYHEFNSHVRDILYLQNQGMIALRTDHDIIIHNLRSLGILTLLPDSSHTEAFTLSSDNDIVALKDYEHKQYNEINAWNITSLQLTQSVRIPKNGSVYRIISLGNNVIAVATANGRILNIDIRTINQSSTLIKNIQEKLYEENYDHIIPLSDQRLVTSDGMRHNTGIKVWNMISKTPLQTIDLQSPIKQMVNISTDRFLALSKNNYIKIFNSRSYQCTQVIKNDAEPDRIQHIWITGHPTILIAEFQRGRRGLWRRKKDHHILDIINHPMKV